MWGIVPAAGLGTRIQPLAFSKELLPLEGPAGGSAGRPRAVSEGGLVSAVEVKVTAPRTRWVWGAFKLSREVFGALFDLWCARGREDQYFGTLVNAWLAAGGRATAVRTGEQYVDVGTFEGYREAMRLIAERNAR